MKIKFLILGAVLLTANIVAISNFGNISNESLLQAIAEEPEPEHKKLFAVGCGAYNFETWRVGCCYYWGGDCDESKVTCFKTPMYCK